MSNTDLTQWIAIGGLSLFTVIVSYYHAKAIQKLEDKS